MRNRYKKEIADAVSRAEQAETKAKAKFDKATADLRARAASDDRRIKELESMVAERDKKIDELDRIANFHRYWLTSGKRADILTAVGIALEQNDIIFDIVEAATKIAALKREIKTDFDDLIDELLSELKKKKDASSEADDDNAADNKEDEDKAGE